MTSGTTARTKGVEQQGHLPRTCGSTWRHGGLAAEEGGEGDRERGDQWKKKSAFTTAHQYMTKGQLHIPSRSPLATIANPKKGVPDGGGSNSNGKSPYCHNSTAKKGQHMSSSKDYHKDQEEYNDTAIALAHANQPRGMED